MQQAWPGPAREMVDHDFTTVLDNRMIVNFARRAEAEHRKSLMKFQL